MQQKGLELNSVTYYHLLRGQQNNIELALETLEDMKKRGIEPTLLTYSLLIRSCRAKTSNTAFNLLKEAEEKGLPVQNEPRMYFDVLRLGTRRDEVKKEKNERDGVVSIEMIAISMKWSIIAGTRQLLNTLYVLTKAPVFTYFEWQPKRGTLN